MSLDGFEKVIHDGNLIAMIIRNDFHAEGIHFFTPPEFSQQLAFMSHKPDKKIEPHTHKEVKREVRLTQECLVIRKGAIRVDLYCNEKSFICSKVLKAGDVILLCSGGHGFEVLEEIEMIEIKQGPYSGVDDKIRFQHLTKPT